MDALNALDLLEIVEARHENASMVFISRCAPAGWHSMIGEGRIADAVVDRILNNSYEIVISGDSMRFRKSFRKKKDPGESLPKAALRGGFVLSAFGRTMMALFAETIWPYFRTLVALTLETRGLFTVKYS